MEKIAQLDKAGLRRFGLITGLIVAVLFGLLLPWLLERAWPLWPWVVAGLLWVPALVYPNALGPVYHGWMKFGAVLGFINTRIILGFFFFAILFPAGLLMRLFGKDPMRRKASGEATYRVESRPRARNSLERPF